MKKNILSVLLLSLFVSACTDERFVADKTAAPLPNPQPMRIVASSGERVKPSFGIESCATHDGKKFQVPFFRAGNKEIYVRRNGNSINDRTISGANRPIIYVNSKPVAALSFWGANKNGFGYPFKELKDDPYTVSIDEKNGIYTYQQPYLTNIGKRATATIKLSSLPDNTVEVSWDSGDPNEGMNPWITFNEHRKKTLSFGGKDFEPNSKEALLANGKEIHKVFKGDIEVKGATPTNSFKIIFDDPNTTGGFNESIGLRNGKDFYSCIYRMHKYPKGSVPSKGKFRIDLGECAVAKNTPPPICGIDFWAYDATHVAQSPTRNLIPNPSFEQGLRYWRVRGGSPFDPQKANGFEIVNGGVFGKSAARLNNNSQYLFPLSLDKDKNYVFSFYAKSVDGKNASVNVNFQNAGIGGKYPGKWGFGDFQNKESNIKITGEWKRYQRTMQGDAAGMRILLQNHGAPVLFDALQLEESADGKPTDFVSLPIDGNLTTSASPMNDVDFGKPISAAFEMVGKAGTEGKVKISVKNIFYENLFEKDFDVKIGDDGSAKIALDFDAKKFGEGIFSVRADYDVKGVPAYTDYFRFSVMKKLSNTHATKDIFGTGQGINHHCDGENVARKFMEWGFGSTTWYMPVRSLKYLEEKKRYEETTKLFIKYKISNNLFAMDASVTERMKKLGNYREWKNITAEMEKIIEENAYIVVKNTPPEVLETFAFGNEEESITAGRYDEYSKAQLAAYRGAKRANPNVKIAPTHGTSGYSSSRGRDAIDGYMQAALKKGIRYDAIGIHPYGNYDYDPLWDFDENVAYLKSRMKHFGYSDSTPLYMSECGNMCDVSIPPWNTPNYDQYKGGKPTYDFGNQEIFQACIYARLYIMALKYYPQLRAVNVWTFEPYIDYNFSPLLLCKSVNTLGNLYPDVKFIDDIRPSANVRGYAFELKDGTGIAAIWTTDLSVIRSQRACPIVRVKFGQPVRFFDINGNERFAAADKNGVTTMPLSFAPLSIKAANVKKLTKALQDAEVEDTSADIQVIFKPTVEGNVEAAVRNTTGRKQEGNIFVGKDKFDYEIEGKKTENILLPQTAQGTEPCTLYKWSNTFRILPARGAEASGKWKMDYFYAPFANGAVDWDKIPALPIDNVSASLDKKSPKDARGTYKIAWDNKNLYLRVEVTDNQFITFPDKWSDPNTEKHLYVFDGSINVYFDTAADARAKNSIQEDDAQASLLKKPQAEGRYDTNDYVYHFAPTADGKDGKAKVWRWIEVDHQLADGVNMPTKQEAASKIKCDFYRTAKGYVYEITFAQRYIEPIVLKRGAIAGFGVCIHDRDKNENVVYGSVSNSTEKGVHTDSNPQFWTLMILK